MKINFRSSNTAGRKKFSDADIVPVFFALEIIFDQDERLVSRTSDAIKSPIRAAFFNRADLDSARAKCRQPKSCLAKEQIGLHLKLSRRARFLQPFDGCGQYNFPAHFEKQFVHLARQWCRVVLRPSRSGNWLRVNKNRTEWRSDQ